MPEPTPEELAAARLLLTAPDWGAAEAAARLRRRAVKQAAIREASRVYRGPEENRNVTARRSLRRAVEEMRAARRTAGEAADARS